MHKGFILSILSLIAIASSTFGQSPEGFKYQAVIRDASNTILNNQVVGVRMTIQQGNIGGTTVYQEVFAPTTSAYGLVNLEIGNGSPVSGDFTTIDWSNGPYFIETAIDVTGGSNYNVMGTSQLMSVPYALHAKTAESALYDLVDDADSDPANELQNIQLSGNQLSIDNGNTVSLPSSPWSQNGNYTYQQTDSIGIGTDNPIDHVQIVGDPTLGSLTISPNESFSGDDSKITLTEDSDNTYSMSLRYDGADNRLYVEGKNNSVVPGPHLGINRDDGRVGIGTGTANPASKLEVAGTVTAQSYVGDASSMTNVYADSLRGSMQANAGDILEWDGSKWNPVPNGRVAFHASASTDLTVANTGYEILNCNNTSSGENFQHPAGVYDNSSFAFTAPYDGVYTFEAAVLWDNLATPAECRNAIFLRVNNTDEVGQWSASGATDFFGTNISSTLKLNAGDEVRVRLYNNAGQPMDTFSQSGKYCYFSGHLVFRL